MIENKYIGDVVRIEGGFARSFTKRNGDLSSLTYDSTHVFWLVLLVVLELNTSSSLITKFKFKLID